MILYASIHNDRSPLCSTLSMFSFGFQDVSVFSFPNDGGGMGHKEEGSFRAESIYLFA